MFFWLRRDFHFYLLLFFSAVRQPRQVCTIDNQFCVFQPSSCRLLAVLYSQYTRMYASFELQLLWRRHGVLVNAEKVTLASHERGNGVLSTYCRPHRVSRHAVPLAHLLLRAVKWTILLARLSIILLSVSHASLSAFCSFAPSADGWGRWHRHIRFVFCLFAFHVLS